MSYTVIFFKNKAQAARVSLGVTSKRAEPLLFQLSFYKLKLTIFKLLHPVRLHGSSCDYKGHL